MRKLLVLLGLCAGLNNGLAHAAVLETVTFDYTARDNTGTATGIFGGQGSFTYSINFPLPGGTVIGRGNITNFQFSWGATVPELGTATWSYGLADLQSFSFNTANINSLSLLTRSVSASNSNFTDAYFSVSGINGKTVRGDQAAVLTSGAVKVALSQQEKARWAKSADETNKVSNVLNAIGCAEGLKGCLGVIAPGLTSDNESPVLEWLGYVALAAAAVAAIGAGSLPAMALVAAGVVGVYASHVSDVERKIAQDPPDANYTVVATYSNTDTPFQSWLDAQFDAAMSQLTSSMTRCLEARQNALVSMERYQGAVLAENATFAAIQLNAMQSFFQDIEGCDSLVGGNLTALLATMSDLGVSDLQFDPDKFDQVRADIIALGNADLTAQINSIDVSEIGQNTTLFTTLDNFAAPMSEENPVPEPAVLLLFGIGVLGLMQSISRKPRDAG
ncbi:PEP-CTERM sorting domain-containing protein [Massilia sp. AB1]|uniref:PEP-CTERM sorting domain-containing protein n=1 Tax=Massilia sp. AB1 TaxID=2823371 RepID=UPI001B82C7A7|nr:PEP-CTERM sorting domain-containing protein [Massilia sp. AB1]MBQ5941079.1 PEP-CTERM sorting domain-containing protein [Massilia sp. AB1]